MFLHKKTNKIFFIAIFALFILSVPSPKKAYAVFVPVHDVGATTVLGEIATTETQRAITDNFFYAKRTIYEQAVCAKEIGTGCIPAVPGAAPTTLDGVANLAAKTLAQLIVKSVTNWVKNGFDGSPQFVQDIKQYYITQAYNIADDFFQSEGIDMCDFFPDLDAVISLTGPKTIGNEARCTIDEIAADAKKFEKNFRSGKWLRFEQSLEKNNNPFGLYMFTQAKLQNKVAANKEDQQTKLGWAKGFLSFEETKTVDGKEVKTGKVLTPGAMVETKLAAVEVMDLSSLNIADEVDELVAALLQQAIKFGLDSSGFFN